MPEIGRESDEVPGDRAAPGAALLQDPRRECMPKVVDAGRSWTAGRDAGAFHNAAEGIVHYAGLERFLFGRREQKIARPRQPAPLVEIKVERLDDAFVKRRQPALAELRFADAQHPARQYVIKPERK